ncbi:MAG: hypothetical protein NDI61_01660 [Bdellovibrionaceae bacterium]|nr:hypothetical protein [Pseudobdellovibrionaceae bacterium]
MKKLGDIMKELGFNPKASKSAQEAFLKNLIRDAYSADIRRPLPLQPVSSTPKSVGESGQLSFQLEDLIAVEDMQRPRRRVGTGTR